MRDKVMGGAAKIGDEQSDKSTSTNTQKANIALKRVILIFCFGKNDRILK
jgi:hypothetical protein